MNITIEINKHSDNWPPHSDSIVERGINAVLDQQNINQAEASVVLANNDFVQTLNRDYRGQDKPTNVLSFPQDLPMLGDIVFAYETVAQEAKEQDKSFDDHLLHLTIHGVLHLLGHDHMNDEEAEEMENLEIELLSKLGVKNPYENF